MPTAVSISNSHYEVDRSEQRKVRADKGVSPGGKQTVRPSGPLITLSEMKVQTVRRTVRKGQENVRRGPNSTTATEGRSKIHLFNEACEEFCGGPPHPRVSNSEKLDQT